MLFARSLAKKMRSTGGFAFSLHPGCKTSPYFLSFDVTDSHSAIRSNLQVHMLTDAAILADGLARAEAAELKEGRVFKRDPQKTLEQGCSSTLVAALDPDLEPFSGEYLVDGGLSEVPVREYARSLENQEKLWRLSEELVGEKFEW